MMIDEPDISNIESVYIIYSADVIGDEQDIERLSPADHMPAGYVDAAREERERVAAKFVETEGDDQYEYGYLAEDGLGVAYCPAGYLDKEGFDLPFQVRVRMQPDERHAPGTRTAQGHKVTAIGDDYELLCVSAQAGEDAANALADQGYEVLDWIHDEDEPVGEGRHRKWVAELTAEEWLIFADAYLIDLDANGCPSDYEDTMGSITEYGHIPAVSVDNQEGWNPTNVLDSRMYVSIALKEANRT